MIDPYLELTMNKIKETVVLAILRKNKVDIGEGLMKKKPYENIQAFSARLNNRALAVAKEKLRNEKGIRKKIKRIFQWVVEKLFWWNT